MSQSHLLVGWADLILALQPVIKSIADTLEREGRRDSTPERKKKYPVTANDDEGEKKLFFARPILPLLSESGSR